MSSSKIVSGSDSVQSPLNPQRNGGCILENPGLHQDSGSCVDNILGSQQEAGWLRATFRACKLTQYDRETQMAPTISPSSSPHFQKSLVLPEDSMVLDFSHWPLVTEPLRSAASPSSWVYTLSLKSLCCCFSRVSLGKRCMHLIHHLHPETFLLVLLFY